MLITRWCRGALSVAAVTVLLGCEPLPTTDTSGSPAVDVSRSVTVALLVPTGSGDAQREALGKSLENAALMAQGDLSGVEIDLRVYSTAGDTGQASAAAQQAMTDGAEIIIGPLFAAAATAVGPVAAAQRVPVLSFSNNSQIAGGNIWLLGTTFENTADRMVGYAAANGLTDLGIVHPAGIEGEQARDAVTRSAGKFGTTIATVQSYPLSVEGITNTAPGIAGAVRDTGATAVMLTDGPTGGLTYVTETLRGLGVRGARFLGLQRWDASTEALGQPGLQGGWFAAVDPGLNAQFAGRYASTYGEQPHPLAGLAYDGVAAVGALISEARAAGSATPFTTAELTKPTGFAGVAGVFRLLADGTNERALAVFEVADGQARVLDPAPRSFTAGGS